MLKISNHHFDDHKESLLSKFAGDKFHQSNFSRAIANYDFDAAKRYIKEAITQEQLEELELSNIDDITDKNFLESIGRHIFNDSKLNDLLGLGNYEKVVCIDEISTAYNALGGDSYDLFCESNSN